MSTAVIGVREMLAAAIQADVGLGVLLSGRKAYTGEAPEGSSLPYVVLEGQTETGLGAGYYGAQYGHQGTVNIRCWARNLWTAQQIYAAVVPLFDHQRPVVSGHRVMKGSMEYVTDGPERVNGKTVKWQVWGRYRVRSLEGA